MFYCIQQTRKLDKVNGSKPVSEILKLIKNYIIASSNSPLIDDSERKRFCVLVLGEYVEDTGTALQGKPPLDALFNAVLHACPELSQSSLLSLA